MDEINDLKQALASLTVKFDSFYEEGRLLQASNLSSPLSAGDTAWMMTSTALVLLMTMPGLALFYSGMVQAKNVLATVMQVFSICCLII